MRAAAAYRRLYDNIYDCTVKNIHVHCYYSPALYSPSQLSSSSSTIRFFTSSSRRELRERRRRLAGELDEELNNDSKPSFLASLWQRFTSPSPSSSPTANVPEPASIKVADTAAKEKIPAQEQQQQQYPDELIVLIKVAQMSTNFPGNAVKFVQFLIKQVVPLCLRIHEQGIPPQLRNYLSQQQADMLRSVAQIMSQMAKAPSFDIRRNHLLMTQMMQVAKEISEKYDPQAALFQITLPFFLYYILLQDCQYWIGVLSAEEYRYTHSTRSSSLLSSFSTANLSPSKLQRLSNIREPLKGTYLSPSSAIMIANTLDQNQPPSLFGRPRLSSSLSSPTPAPSSTTANHNNTNNNNTNSNNRENGHISSSPTNTGGTVVPAAARGVPILNYAYLQIAEQIDIQHEQAAGIGGGGGQGTDSNGSESSSSGGAANGGSSGSGQQQQPLGVSSFTRIILGAGSASRVYRGSFKGQPVAIKMIFCPELTPEAIGSFYHEATLLSQLRHDNLVQLLGLCVVPPAICLVMELCMCNLYDYVRSTPLSLGRQMALALDCCSAVSYLHTRTPPILHLDIKALNFLIDRYTRRAKISDLELSRELLIQVEDGEVGEGSEKGAGNAQLLRGSELTGFRLPETQYWLAPELLLGQPYTARADVYSLALVIWEIFSASTPYRALEDALMLAARNVAKRVAVEQLIAQQQAQSMAMQMAGMGVIGQQKSIVGYSQAYNAQGELQLWLHSSTLSHAPSRHGSMMEPNAPLLGQVQSGAGGVAVHEQQHLDGEDGTPRVQGGVGRHTPSPLSLNLNASHSRLVDIEHQQAQQHLLSSAHNNSNNAHNINEPSSASASASMASSRSVSVSQHEPVWHGTEEAQDSSTTTTFPVQFIGHGHDTASSSSSLSAPAPMHHATSTSTSAPAPATSHTTTTLPASLSQDPILRELQLLQSRISSLSTYARYDADDGGHAEPDALAIAPASTAGTAAAASSSVSSEAESSYRMPKIHRVHGKRNKDKDRRNKNTNKSSVYNISRQSSAGTGTAAGAGGAGGGGGGYGSVADTSYVPLLDTSNSGSVYLSITADQDRYVSRSRASSSASVSSMSSARSARALSPTRIPYMPDAFVPRAAVQSQLAQLISVAGYRPPMPPSMPDELARLVRLAWSPLQQDRPSAADMAARVRMLCVSMQMGVLGEGNEEMKG